MKYHPYILSEITQWNFFYLEGNLFHILDRSERNMDIVSINFKCAWEMSQKCTSTTCASKTYHNIFLCINFRTVHYVQFVKYDVTVSFMAQVLDTVTYLVPQVLDTASSSNCLVRLY